MLGACGGLVHYLSLLEVTMRGKRFYFATIAVIVASVVTVMLGYSEKGYIQMLGLIVGIFCISQSYTDAKKGDKP